jgi:hypothetical protein
MNSRARRLDMYATSVIAAMLGALALTLTGCGGVYGGGSSSTASAPQATSQARGTRAFAWLRPSPPPRPWHTGRLPGGVARLAYPLGWRSIRSDPGTFSAALRVPTGKIRGYLNATPRQGTETLSNWGSFRLDHNRDEGDVDVTPIASATNLEFRSGHGSCVIDVYRSSSGRRYREVACIVAGATATTVVVGAAPPAQWSRQGPALERAISSFLT